MDVLRSNNKTSQQKPYGTAYLLRIQSCFFCVVVAYEGRETC